MILVSESRHFTYANKLHSEAHPLSLGWKDYCNFGLTLSLSMMGTYLPLAQGTNFNGFYRAFHSLEGRVSQNRAWYLHVRSLEPRQIRLGIYAMPETPYAALFETTPRREFVVHTDMTGSLIVHLPPDTGFLQPVRLKPRQEPLTDTALMVL